jgi:hypothetical protein
LCCVEARAMSSIGRQSLTIWVGSWVLYSATGFVLTTVLDIGLFVWPILAIAWVVSTGLVIRRMEDKSRT